MKSNSDKQPVYVLYPLSKEENKSPKDPARLFSKLKSVGNIKQIILMIFIVVAFFIIGAIIYFGFIRQKISDRRSLSSLTSQVTALKISIKRVKGSIESIHYLVTQDVYGRSVSLQKSDAATLGVSYLYQVFLSLKNSFKDLLNRDRKVAGKYTESEDKQMVRMKAIKKEITAGVGYISKAENELKLYKEKLYVTLHEVPKSMQEKIQVDDDFFTNATQFLNEAKRITDYYKNISEVLISANEKIISFKNTVNSASTIMSGIDPKKMKSIEIKSELEKVQVSLDQAKKDTDDIAKLAESFGKNRGETLPFAMDRYHEHNQKVFNVILAYFNSISKNNTGIYYDC